MDHATLLPGWGTSPERMGSLATGLRARDVTTDVWSYSPQGSIAAIADDLARRVGDSSRRLHLVGHSLGGLVVAHTASHQLRGQVESVTTINTPFRGTWLSYTGTGPLASSLRWGSTILDELREAVAAELDADDGARWLLLSAAGDLAATATSALRVGTRADRLERRLIAANGHSISLLSDRIIDAVTDHVVRTPATAR